MQETKFKTTSEYIKSFPKETQVLLEKMRRAIKESAPKSEEAMRYGMPTFRLNGNLVHFGIHKSHIGFYPTPSAIVKFKKDLVNYATSKGAIQFRIDKPLPLVLVKKIVKFRVGESLAKSKSI